MPKKYVMFQTPDGSSRVNASDESFLIPSADRYSINGLDHISSYISRLFEYSSDFKSISIFTPSGDRGLALHSRNGKIEAVLSLCKQKELEMEHSIRSFFKSLGIRPSKDYLASNGRRVNATLVLVYPLDYDLQKVATFARRILVELYEVRPDGGLQIKYWRKKRTVK
jgi:hypothetical protein